MALDKASLGSAIATAFSNAHGQGPQAADTTLANAIADAIDTYVKGGAVATVVTGTLPAGPVAAVGSGSMT